MGMLIDGIWTERDEVIEDGAYVRPQSRYDGPLDGDRLAALAEPGRHHLVASWSCPWSHRAMLARTIERLGERIAIHMAGEPRTQGYAMNGGRPWTVPGTDREIVFLHELYALADPQYSGRVTLPVLWDAQTATIVSNESAAIMRGFDAVNRDWTLVPDALRRNIDALNADIHARLNNGVYRAGFATAQDAYEAAVSDVFACLDELDERLAARRYLFGNALTETDLRLFPTLIRFDAVYYILFKCARRRIVDYPNLWRYLRDLHAWRGIADTIDWQIMRMSSYLNDTDSAHPLVAVMPAFDLAGPHDGERFGEAALYRRDGDAVPIDPKTGRPLEP